MTLDDWTIVLVAFSLSIIIRWTIFSGPNWGRTLLKILPIPLIPTLYKLMRLDFFQETLIIVCIFAIAFICVWLARWPTNWLVYSLKVLRGVAKAAEVKADAYAGVTSGMRSSIDELPGSTPGTDDIYAEIATEFDTHNIETGLWTRLYAECDGDETKTKVRYIRERVLMLSAQRQIPSSLNSTFGDKEAKAKDTTTAVAKKELTPKERERAMEEMIKRMK